MDESDNQDLAWLIVAVVGVAAGMKVWASKIKPWLADLVPSLRKEGGIEVGRWISPRATSSLAWSWPWSCSSLWGRCGPR